MKLPIYQVDAFADKLFAGNPAAVCPLEKWLPDDLMQKIAMENNLAETAFVVRRRDLYEIRWFTPQVEVDLCGHATLASAYVLFYELGVSGDMIRFHSHRSGALSVAKNGDLLTLDFPADALNEVEVTNALSAPFGKRPTKAFRGKTDFMLVFETESDIAKMTPDMKEVKKLDARGVIVTAKGEHSDYVARFFGPQSGIDEDPATGSSHCSLVPYWSKVLGKKKLEAIQLSARVGKFILEERGERILISGKAALFLKGEISI
jgi:PhzF family phenazine biosynthesis protein